MPRHHRPSTEAADALLRTAPLVNRWIERLLAGHEPPLTVAQYLTLQAVDDGDVVGAELARRAGVSGAAVSQLLAFLEADRLLTRERTESDRRRQPIELTSRGGQVLHSAQSLLRERLAAFLAGFPPPEADALARALREVESVISGTAPPRRPPRPPPLRHPRPPGEPDLP